MIPECPFRPEPEWVDDSDVGYDRVRSASWLRQIHFYCCAAAESARRFSRLLIFGLELLIVSRLLARRRYGTPLDITTALLDTKSVRRLPPELAVTGRHGAFDCWSRGFSAVNAALFLNLQNPDELSASRYAHPAPAFRAIYLWDSAFIAQVWKWWDPEVSWDVLRAVIDCRDGDRMQHFAARFSRSKLTQPPLLAWSLDRLEQAAGAELSLDWMRKAWPPLRAYHDWLCTHRRLPNGLFAWAHPYESGVDNAPRFSSRDERRLDDTRRLAAPDFSAYMMLNCEALARMARRLGRRREAAALDAEAALLRKAINEFLWDGEDGLYFDRDIISGEFVRSRTIASLLPLWAGVPDPAQAQRLLAHILEPSAFNTVIPLPSVALSEETFERDMWRGPVWVNTAFAVIAGLRRYEFREAAADFAFRLCDGIYRTFDETGRFHEFYDPDRPGIEALRRKRGNRWKRITLGSGPVADFVGWSGLVNTLVMEVLFGLQRTDGGMTMCPRFPPRAAGLRFSLTLPSDGLAIDLEVGENGTVRGYPDPDGGRRFEAAFGETVFLAAGGKTGCAA